MVTTATEGSSGSESTSFEVSTAACWRSGSIVVWILRRRLRGERQGLVLGLHALPGGDHTLFLHQPQDAVAALSDLPLDNVTIPGHVGRRGVQQTGDRRRLREIE